MAMTSNPSAADDQGVTLDDLRREVGDKWICAPITAGFRGVPRGVRGTPIPRYGRTPAELLESIRHAERQP
jgi:hypothetical protein